MTPEFSRVVRVETVGEEPHDMMIEANEQERAALAVRFGLIAVDRLEARFALCRDGAAVLVDGRVVAIATQACSITGEPLDVSLDEEAQLRFAQESVTEEEVELDDEAIDVLPIEDGAIDVGEAAAETLALSLDAFPRGPNAQAALAKAGVIAEDEVRPFSALSGLKDKLAAKNRT